MGLFRLRIVAIVGYFYYLILPKPLHLSVVRPSSSRNILARITRLIQLTKKTDPYIYIYIYIYIYLCVCVCVCVCVCAGGGACGSVAAKPLGYKPEGRVFENP
jgi:hypothetical protein